MAENVTENRMKSKVERTRLVVLTDISTLIASHGEPDDTQSLIRLLLYANYFQIEGLIATYTKHCEGKTFAGYIETIVRQYGKVREKLLEHAEGYPSEQELLAVIKAGSPMCGLENMG